MIVTLQIKDDAYEKFLYFFNHFKEDLTIIESRQNDEIDLLENLKEAVDDVNNGRVHTVDTLWDGISD